MAGIYIHIPYCKQKCHYCDFHFSTQLNTKKELIDAMLNEIKQQSKYLNQEPISSIYFGGGTPSILNKNELKVIVDQIYSIFKVKNNIEFTLECNPDDLTLNKLGELKQIGVNRLSIGIQSFEQSQLEFMNRAHSATEAIQCVKWAQEVGFENLTIDLIYGLPNTNQTYWQNQIRQAIDLGVNHISAYHLTIEEGTAFGYWQQKGQLSPLNDEQSIEQFKLLIHTLKDHGFEHYEISNFAKPGAYSKHNTAYWFGKPYLGIGPSAHSFNGKTRQWNVANNYKYIQNLNQNNEWYETEELSVENQFNEFILTRLRTQWGLPLSDLFQIHSANRNETLKQIEQFVNQNEIKWLDEDTIVLTEDGKLMADYICAALFIDSEN